MNKGMLTVGIILLSLIALLMLNVLNNYSTGSELDYYLVKETVDASMLDSLDKTFATECGIYRLDKEKFVENFLYRFVSNVDGTRTYDVRFYDINEVPPIVSVKIDSLTVLGVKAPGEDTAQAADISTSYDAIVESKYISDINTEILLRDSENPKCKQLLATMSASKNLESTEEPK